MAAGAYKEKEHAFKTIGKDIKEGRIPRLVLLCGKEEYLIRWYTDALVDRYVSDACKPLDFTVLEGETLTVDKIKESLETMSIMSERKVVLLPYFTPAIGKPLKGFHENDIKALIEYFEHIPEGSMLIMTATDPEDIRTERERQKLAGNKVRRAVNKHGAVYDFQPLYGNLLRGFIDKRFRSAGKLCKPSVIEHIIFDSGYDNKAIEYNLYNLDNDLKKIIAHCGNAPEITMEDVSGTLTSNPENNIFAMLDAVGRKRKDEAFMHLNNLLQSKINTFELLRNITNQMELILMVKEMRGEGMTPAQMQKKLGVHEFKIKKAMGVTGLYSMEDLRKALSDAYQVDENIKTGLFDGQLALELLIAKL